MRLVTVSNKILKSGRRCMCTDNVKDKITKKVDKDTISKHVKDFLSEDSPLKGWGNKNFSEVREAYQNVKSNDKIDPGTTSIIMFPGQGNQFVGMGKALMEHQAVEDMFDAASTILNYDLKKLCLKGPKTKLDRTEYCQPAILVCCLASLEELKQTYPLAISNCVATCGFSLGEIAALVFAGCITFEKAVHITRVRAKAMQVCSEKVPSGLLTVLLGADSILKNAIEDAKKECILQGISDPVCQISNYLFPECKVVGGHNEALKYLEKNQQKYKLRKVIRLPVSGAFHTTLMQEAAEPFRKALSKLEIKNPRVPVLSNVEILPYKDASHIKKLLPKQIYKPVKWEQIMQYLYARTPGTNFPHTYECGPGNSLSVILQRVNFPASQNCHKIEI